MQRQKWELKFACTHTHAQATSGPTKTKTHTINVYVHASMATCYLTRIKRKSGQILNIINMQ